ncbi:MFS family permease [Thermosipho japonicus]|uniref:MFS family permease n=1 Tax=Thermosipho japonicus TaxID=90323 RepID=A0A841GMG2_9BACT|nr:MFS transporter [Thermosipho japonicus]MBB6062344.1 MFS family permease [Thermosipho japonicus]
MIKKDKQFRKFQMYGFFKNLRFFEPFLILFFLSSGLSYLQIGVLYSIKSIATNILEIPTGVVADLYGRKKSMIFSMISYIVSFLIFYFSRSFYLFILAMIFFSFGDAFRTGTHKAMIFQYLKLNGMYDLKVQYYGATRAASQLGSALNSLIAASIVFVSGNYRTVFFIAILPYVLNLINLATYPNELDKAEKKKTKKQTLKDFIDAVASWRVLKILLNTSSYSAIFKSLKDYLQPILESFALSIPIFVWLDDKKRSSIVIGIVYFFLYLLTSYASKNSWKIGKKSSSFALNLTLFVGALSVIFAGVSYIFNFYIISILIFIVLYVLENLRRPIAVSYVGDNVESDALASVLSVESQTKTLLTAVFSIVLGFFADKFGVGQAISILGVILLLMSLFFKIKD